MDRYFGLYWTLPVSWAGFTSLPKDPKAAAAKSRAIAQQRERVRRWVAEAGGDLVAEEVFLELAPDRASEEILPAVDRLLRRAKEQDARLVLVDFSEAYGWRKHAPLREHLARHPDLHVMLDPAPLPLAGAEAGAFDPVEHFRAWREVKGRHAATKPRRKAKLADAIAQRQGEHASLADSRRRSTPTGSPLPPASPGAPRTCASSCK